MRFVFALAGWLLALFSRSLWYTIRTRLHDDPRPLMRARGAQHIFAGRHAHQISLLFANDERPVAALLSRSKDADLLLPSIKLFGHIPVRGSSSKRKADGTVVAKGGSEALMALAAEIERGIAPIVTVDGPRGPRNVVNPGVAILAQRTGAEMLPVIATCTRRWIFTKTWDRLQLPKPFSRIDAYFGTPIAVPKDGSIEDACRALASQLDALEAKVDRDEFERSKPRPMSPGAMPS